MDDGLSSYTLREMSVFKELDHPNVIKMLEIIIQKDIFLIFEYMNQDLKQLLDSLKSSQIMKPTIIKVCIINRKLCINFFLGSMNVIKNEYFIEI